MGNDKIGKPTTKSEIHQDLLSSSESSSMSNDVKLSEVLKREIGSRTQSEVAKAADVPNAFLNDLVSARRNPSGKNFPQLLKLANFFGLTLEELIFDRKPSGRTTLASTRFNDRGTEYVVSIERNDG